MVSRTPIALGSLIVATLTACTRELPTAGQAQTDRPIAMARGNVDTDSRLRVEYFDMMSDGVTNAGITGDNRLADGSSSNAGYSSYQGDLCGVRAKIWWYNTSASQSGDATLDPDADRATCGAVRYLTFKFGSAPVKVSAFANVRQVMQLTLDQPTRLQRMGYELSNVSNCDRIVFDGASQILVTRTDTNADPTAPRTWTAESQAPHQGYCEVYSKGAYRQNGVTYILPFRMALTEIR
jgi:hypothetical protein